jgi:hypothetical protein
LHLCDLARCQCAGGLPNLHIYETYDQIDSSTCMFVVTHEFLIEFFILSGDRG